MNSNTSKPFKIAIFTDLHYGEAPNTIWGPLQDIGSTMVIKSIVNAELPDFVVFLGDLVTGEDIVYESWRLTNRSGHWKPYFDKMFLPLVELNIPWASVYGNHDTSPLIDKSEIVAYEHSFPGSFTQSSQGISGVTNYHIKVMENGAPKMILLFLDSQGNSSDLSTPNWIQKDQVMYAQDLHQQITRLYGKLPWHVFVHIPFEPFGILNEKDPFPCQGLHDERRLALQKQDEGLLNFIMSNKIQSVHSGHDHGSGWCCEWESTQFCFARRSGYGGYGKWRRGSRILEFQNDGSFQTRISWSSLL